jgi:hypothetical protein
MEVYIMKKLLTLLLAAAFGLQAAESTPATGFFGFLKLKPKAIPVVAATPAPAPTLVEKLDKVTFGDSARASAQWASDKYTATTENATAVYKGFLVPLWNNTWTVTSQTWTATKDLAVLTKDTGYEVGRFMCNHPQFTLAVGATVALYYYSRAATGVIEAQYLKMQKFIDNTLAEVQQFDIRAENIRAEKNAVLASCDLRFIVNNTLGIGAWYYQDEVRAIDNFFSQVVTLKGYLTANRQDSNLINSQMREVRDAAALVQLVLAKRLNLYAAQRILARK